MTNSSKEHVRVLIALAVFSLVFLIGALYIATMANAADTFDSMKDRRATPLTVDVPVVHNWTALGVGRGSGLTTLVAVVRRGTIVQISATATSEVDTREAISDRITALVGPIASDEGVTTWKSKPPIVAEWNGDDVVTVTIGAL